MSKRGLREFNPEWVSHIPELATRPNLLKAIETDRKLRRKLFQSSYQFESVALIPSKSVARRCLYIWWRELRRELFKYYHNRLRLETGNDILFNELFGCIRNVYINMIYKAKAEELALPKLRENDVLRDYKN